MSQAIRQKLTHLVLPPSLSSSPNRCYLREDFPSSHTIKLIYLAFHQIKLESRQASFANSTWKHLMNRCKQLIILVQTHQNSIEKFGILLFY